MTEKSISPTGGNLFSPGVTAPGAPSVAPGLHQASNGSNWRRARDPVQRFPPQLIRRRGGHARRLRSSPTFGARDFELVHERRHRRVSIHVGLVRTPVRQGV